MVHVQYCGLMLALAGICLAYPAQYPVEINSEGTEIILRQGPAGGFLGAIGTALVPLIGTILSPIVTNLATGLSNALTIGIQNLNNQSAGAAGSRLPFIYPSSFPVISESAEDVEEDESFPDLKETVFQPTTLTQVRENPLRRKRRSARFHH